MIEKYLNICPQGFILPKQFENILQTKEFLDIRPWRFFINQENDLIRFKDLFKKKYPTNTLIPFAYIHDMNGFYNDGYPVVASFDVTEKKSSTLIRIYDFSVPNHSPWDNLSYFSFDGWLDMAKEESLLYKNELAELGILGD